ncbi:MAG TPA: indolepyruvate oxidoreductase subunit beta [Firmicutes bacterium]|nr:indolepyruvate oxidoreductase subunit beta [Bacillota bacterium]
MNDIKNILLVGVGGQGVLTASEILSEALMLEGFDVKKAEVHGMSQRGGSVNSHLRYGRKVYSPLIEEGKADIIFSFELVEALRFSKYLKEEGFIVCSNEKIIPNSVYFSQVKYPKDPAGALKTAFGKKFYLIDAVNIARELGNVRFANVVLLGTVSHLMKISDTSMKKAVESMVPPKYVTGNLNAFEKGKELAR